MNEDELVDEEETIEQRTAERIRIHGGTTKFIIPGEVT